MAGLIAATTLAVSLAPGMTWAETPDSDPRAVAIADQVMAALGGRARWDSLPGLEWTFESAVADTLRPGRRHCWDKLGGRHRVEGRTRQGQPFVAIHNLGATDGMAWVAGTRLEGDSLQKMVRRANSTWINDTYWMLMPYKLRDPGVHLAYAGDTTLAGATCDRIALSFEQVGETPGDRYWVYVNRANHRVERWDYVLEGNQPPAVSWTWEGWEQHEGLWFPTAHRQGKVVIYTRAIHTPRGFAANVFSSPE